MILAELSQLFERDLKKLSNQIAMYKDEDLLWTKASGISNSAGNLALHINGNLQHFVGAVLGETGYIRDREFEFGDQKVPKQQIIDEVELTIAVVQKTLSNMVDNQLGVLYPIEVFGQPMSTSFFLMHLHSHLNYHLGQINYHRRILSKNAG
ncbi:MAG: DinB family protein [Cyclobacteriaceae bacterium]